MHINYNYISETNLHHFLRCRWATSPILFQSLHVVFGSILVVGWNRGTLHWPIIPRWLIILFILCFIWTGPRRKPFDPVTPLQHSFAAVKLLNPKNLPWCERFHLRIIIVAALRPPSANQPPNTSPPSHASSELSSRPLSFILNVWRFLFPSISPIKCLHKHVAIKVVISRQLWAALPFLLPVSPQAKHVENSFCPISYCFLFTVHTSNSFRPILFRWLFSLHTCLQIWIRMKFVHRHIVPFLCCCSIAVTFKVPPNYLPSSLLQFRVINHLFNCYCSTNWLSVFIVSCHQAHV
jgi:hypothetical protein